MTFRSATKLSEALRAAAEDLEASLQAESPKTRARMDRWLTWTRAPEALESRHGEARDLSAGICTACLVGGILVREYDALRQLAKAARIILEAAPATRNEADIAFEIRRAASGDDDTDVSFSVRTAVGNTAEPGDTNDTVAKLMSIEEARRGHWWTAILMGNWRFDGDPDEVRANVKSIREPRPMLTGTMRPEEAKRLIDDIRDRAVPQLQAAGA